MSLLARGLHDNEDKQTSIELNPMFVAGDVRDKEFGRTPFVCMQRLSRVICWP